MMVVVADVGRPVSLRRMLAYVFWHWPAAEVSSDDYERLQAGFHRGLAEARIPGFQASTAFRIDGQASWLGGAPAYVDWYLLDGSAALDTLNEAAVSGMRKGPHDVLARAMGAGAGSLLQARTTVTPEEIKRARWATWLAKPKGMPYDPFYGRLAPVYTRPGVSLWRRQMVLGPTTEFGLLSSEPLHLPPGLESLALRLQPIVA
jgi:hypothetical protein